VRVFYVVCVSNDGHLEGFDLCVVREEGFAGVSEVGFSSLQEPFTWGDRRVFGLAEWEGVCLDVKPDR